MRTLQLRKPAAQGRLSRPPSGSARSSAGAARGPGVGVDRGRERAAEEAVGRWRHRAEAGDDPRRDPGPRPPSDELLRTTSRAIAAWQDHITELIRTEGVTKRSVCQADLVRRRVTVVDLTWAARRRSAEAGGTAGACRSGCVQALLGAESLRSIGAKARSDLRARIGMLFDEEIHRVMSKCSTRAGIPDESAATRLYQATYNLEVAR